MFDFLKFRASTSDISEYGNKLSNLIVNNNLDNKALIELSQFTKKNKFTTKQIIEGQKIACSQCWNELIKDFVISDEDKTTFEKMLNFCQSLSEEDKKSWEEKIFIHHSLYNIEHNNILPNLNKSNLNILFKTDERLHFVLDAELMKKSRVTKKINYSGPTVSIKICKGVRYRIGSANVSRSVEEFWTADDFGTFWISNLRIGYIGENKNFVFPINKVHSLTVGEAGLSIFKEGRANPFIVSMKDYELACAIISKLVNE